MYYVVRKDEPLENYHAAFVQQHKAREYAEGLRRDLGHNYDVVRVETVWTTQTLAEAMEE